MRNFEHSVNVLVKAYFNNTLINGHPCGCAVGNLIADAIGTNVRITRETVTCSGRPQPMANWGIDRENEDLETAGFKWFNQIEHRRGHISEPTEDNFIDKTGYTEEEIDRIELAFEEPRISFVDDGDGYDLDKIRFVGLMKVVDVLADIHKIDLSQKEQAKALFVK